MDSFKFMLNRDGGVLMTSLSAVNMNISTCYVEKRWSMKPLKPFLKPGKIVIQDSRLFSTQSNRMSNLLTIYDPDSEDPEIRRKSELLKRIWSRYCIVYDPLKAGSIDGTDSQPHDRAITRAQKADYKPNSKVKGKPENTIFVSGLSRKTTEQDVKEEFSRFGEVVRCRLVQDIVTGRSRGYAFVEYAREKDALNAFQRGFKMRLDGSQLFVDMECERLLPGWVPRRLGGGFNGRKESGQLRFGGRLRAFKKPLHLLTEQELLGQFGTKLNKGESNKTP
ncbi:U11/U12 small nuclear ribonucleoprotein 35 kDa protein-like [Cimex lectularius]|uniref:U11/U12 small nuclear ribonucleoprotein 35 kDa protein n=1 Tax=Cimex lectularius TaxID=79782 RepID=A0A8I6S798_CIMLE|nr:U11/U12 small nuclear ribonucleoprotein 35 kDa protein-like [Cimex lectularius]XP_014257469.1 U11/U12 small nuclear ribonucleoprotein 35 kDa protein-like [Cimex lectularius]